MASKQGRIVPMNEFLFLAGTPWLDLLNTRPRVRSAEVDLLPDGHAVLDWLEKASDHHQLAPVPHAAHLDLPALHSTTLELRDLLADVAAALAAGRKVQDDIISTLNRILAAAPIVLEVDVTIGRLRADTRPLPGHPAALLHPVLRSVVDHIVAVELPTVRKCENLACVLFFVDTSRAHSRRWCSMATCGNRIKAARHYRRSRTPTVS
jgi:predicted RNA-binding Zn ribbon-like protein